MEFEPNYAGPTSFRRSSATGVTTTTTITTTSADDILYVQSQFENKTIGTTLGYPHLSHIWVCAPGSIRQQTEIIFLIT